MILAIDRVAGQCRPVVGQDRFPLELGARKRVTYLAVNNPVVAACPKVRVKRTGVPVFNKGKRPSVFHAKLFRAFVHRFADVAREAVRQQVVKGSHVIFEAQRLKFKIPVPGGVCTIVRYVGDQVHVAVQVIPKQVVGNDESAAAAATAGAVGKLEGKDQVILTDTAYGNLVGFISTAVRIQTTADLRTAHDRAYRHREDLRTAAVDVHLYQLGTAACLAEAPQVRCRWSVGPPVKGKAVEAAKAYHRERSHRGARHIEERDRCIPVVGPEAHLALVVCNGTAGRRRADGVVNSVGGKVHTPQGAAGIRAVEQLIIVVIGKVTDI